MSLNIPKYACITYRIIFLLKNNVVNLVNETNEKNKNHENRQAKKR